MRFLFFILSFNLLASNPEPELIGGTPVDIKDWPASVYARMSGAACSATVVGSRTLLIASHCVQNGARATFSVGGNSYSSVCTRTPEYRNNATADWALCLVDRPVSGIQFENINTDVSRITVGAELMLTGYGGTQKGSGSGGNDGVMRQGIAPVIRLPSGTNNDIVTQGPAALAYGDSGGAAYHIGTDGKRVIVGINSRGDIRTTSYLPSMTTQTAVNFMTSWTQTNGQKICGFSTDATNCRESVPEEPCSR